MTRRTGACITVITSALFFALAPAAILAQESTEKIEPSELTGYDVEFTLPTAAQAGCLVCHADEGLMLLRAESLKSFYVDTEELAEGPHAEVQCVGCHLDFVSQMPHIEGTEDWRRIAKSACKNCHDGPHIDVSEGAHGAEFEVGVTPSEDEKERPLCGDCHGGHDIVYLTDHPEGQAELHRDGWQVCGRCHEDYWKSYNDYYHGRAYKRGALDAPACWDCHGAHAVFPSTDRRSMVHELRLEETCGACHYHQDVNETYVGYSVLVHGHEEVLEANPLYAFFQRVREFFLGLFGRQETSRTALDTTVWTG